MATKTYRKHLLEQRSPGFLALGTSFVEDKFFHSLGGDGFRPTQAHYVYHAQFVSTTIPSAPPQVIRHQIPEVGDPVLEAPGQKGRRTVTAALGGAPRQAGEEAPAPRAPRGKHGPRPSVFTDPRQESLVL